MWRAVRLGALGWLVVVAGAGCYASRPEPTVSEMEFRRQLVEARCAWIASCLLDGSRDLHSSAEAWCRGTSGLTTRTPPRAIDLELAQACIEQFAEQPCWQPTDPEICQVALAGAVRFGEPCRRFDDCEPGTQCRGCPRTCVAVGWEGSACAGAGDCDLPFACIEGTCRVAELGEPCAASRVCQRDLVCGRTSPRTCVTPPLLGEVCMRLESLGAEDRCADRSLVCVVTGDPFGGTCVLGATEGEACGEGRRCSTGHVCVGGVCVARALPGAECVAPEVCVPFHTCMAGRCVPLPLVGDSCDVLPCVYGMCEDGVCRLKNPGEPCELGECSTYCDTETGLCGTPTPEGEACESFFQCEPGLTCWGPPDDAGVCRRC